MRLFDGHRIPVCFGVDIAGAQAFGDVQHGRERGGDDDTPHSRGVRLRSLEYKECAVYSWGEKLLFIILCVEDERRCGVNYL